MRSSLTRIIFTSLAGLLLACGSGASAGLATDPSPLVVAVGERLEISLVSEEPLTSEPDWEIQELHGGGLLVAVFGARRDRR